MNKRILKTENGNTDNNQIWFEGMAKYVNTISLGGFPMHRNFEYKEYYKNGKIMIERYDNFIGVSKILFNNKKQTTLSKITGKEIERIKTYEQPPIKIEKIDRKHVKIKGHKCIKVIHSTYTDSTETKSIHWVDESYTIPFAEGRIAEVPKGLVVKGEVWAQNNEINFSYTIELTEIKQTEVSDSNFKL